MNSAAPDETVRLELEHIGPAMPGSDQDALRNEYAIYRREDLARDKNASPRDALFKAITSVRSYAPDFKPEYEARFFAS